MFGGGMLMLIGGGGNLCIKCGGGGRVIGGTICIGGMDINGGGIGSDGTACIVCELGSDLFVDSSSEAASDRSSTTTASLP